MDNDNTSDNIPNIECDIESQNKIKIRLLEIQNQYDLNNLNLGFYDRKTELRLISLQQAQERFDTYKIISKLALYIIIDYEIFHKMTIQSTFTNDIYNTAMQNLGYQQNGTSWNLMYKPSLDVVIDYIYKYCYYAYIVTTIKNQKVESSSEKLCFFCDNKIIDKRCTICSAHVDEMGDRKIVLKSKIYDDKHFVCEGNENIATIDSQKTCLAAIKRSGCSPDQDILSESRRNDDQQINQGNENDTVIDSNKICQYVQSDSNKDSDYDVLYESKTHKEDKHDYRRNENGTAIDSNKTCLDIQCISNMDSNEDVFSESRTYNYDKHCAYQLNEKDTVIDSNETCPDMISILNIKNNQELFSEEKTQSNTNKDRAPTVLSKSKTHKENKDDYQINKNGIAIDSKKISLDMPSISNMDSNKDVFSEDRNHSYNQHYTYQRNENDTVIDSNETCPDMMSISNIKNNQELFSEEKILEVSKVSAPQENVDDTSSCTVRNDRAISWTCAYCQYENFDQEIQNCAVCEAFRGKVNHTNKQNVQEPANNKLQKTMEIQDKWKCIFCTFLNDKSNKICEVCLKLCKNNVVENIDIFTDLDVPEETSQCKECNIPKNYKCQNCRSRDLFFNKWKCEKCSFFNEKLDKSCQVCDADNINLINCPRCRKIKIHKQYDTQCVECDMKNENMRKFFEEESQVSLDTMKDGKNISTNKNDKNKNDSQFKILSTTTNTSKENSNIIQFEKAKHSHSNSVLENSTRKFSSISDQLNDNDKSEKILEIQGKWECTSCTFLNDKSKKICEVCLKLCENSDKEKVNDDLRTKISDNAQTKDKNSKHCSHCKNPLKVNEDPLCSKCEIDRWYCGNEACGAINYKKKYSQDQYCDKCKAKIGSNFSNCTTFDVFRENRTIRMWQCCYCFQFNIGVTHKCSKCENLRLGSNNKMCSCKWINLSVADKCKKCDKILDFSEVIYRL